jgi:hypothetical protein
MCPDNRVIGSPSLPSRNQYANGCGAEFLNADDALDCGYLQWSILSLPW